MVVQHTNVICVWGLQVIEVMHGVLQARLLVVDAKHRLTAQQALQHPWMQVRSMSTAHFHCLNCCTELPMVPADMLLGL